MFGYTLFIITIVNAFVSCNANFEPLFEKWATQFHINFRDVEHRGRIVNNWVGNHKFIETENNKNNTYTLGHNQFSGMNSDEFSEYLTLFENNHIHVNPADTKKKVFFVTNRPGSEASRYFTYSQTLEENSILLALGRNCPAETSTAGPTTTPSSPYFPPLSTEINLWNSLGHIIFPIVFPPSQSAHRYSSSFPGPALMQNST